MLQGHKIPSGNTHGVL
eukprot:Gb_19583 [translate_table: standard]